MSMLPKINLLIKQWIISFARIIYYTIKNIIRTTNLYFVAYEHSDKSFFDSPCKLFYF